LYANEHYQGLADGARENWDFLNTITDTQTLGFYHATEYLDKAAKAIYRQNEQAQKAWMDTHCHRLKHEVGTASMILAEMQTIQPKRVSQAIFQGLQDAMTYFRNHHHQMLYVEAISSNLPIGSGSTEAACKVIIKAQLGVFWHEMERLGSFCRFEP